MITVLAVTAGVYLCSSIALAVAVHHAPEGFEDEHGFQIVWTNNDPEISDVVCVWAGAAA